MNIKTDLTKKENKTYVLYVDDQNGASCTDEMATHIAKEVVPQSGIDNSNLAIVSGDEFNNVAYLLRYLNEKQPKMLILHFGALNTSFNLTNNEDHDDVIKMLQKTIDDKRSYTVLETYIIANDFTDVFNLKLDANGNVVK